MTEWLQEHAPDCGDNSCLFGGRGKGGMRTNGGCRCFKDVRPDMRRIFIERMWAELSAPSAIATPKLDETFFWPIGFINNDGGVTWELGREPGEHTPGKLVYIVREPK